MQKYRQTSSPVGVRRRVEFVCFYNRKVLNSLGMCLFDWVFVMWCTKVLCFCRILAIVHAQRPRGGLPVFLGGRFGIILIIAVVLS